MKRIYLVIALVFTVLLGLHSCKETATTPDTENLISGTIVNESGSPIQNALVELMTNESKVLSNKTTAEDGKFAFTTAIEDLTKLKLRITANGYDQLISSVNGFLKENESKPNNLNILMSKLLEQDTCCGQLTIIVRKYNTDIPLSGASVKLSKGDKTIGIETTGENGKAIFSTLCEGKYWIRVALDGYNVVEEDYKINGNCDTLQLEIGLKEKEQELCCNNIAKFVIKNAEGNPIKGARVLLRKGGVIKYEGSADADGKVGIDGICKGEYSVLVKYEGYTSQEFEMNFDCEQTLEKSVTLQKSNDLCCNNIAKFVIKNADGNPIKGARVLLRINGVVKYEGTADADGKISIDGICKGDYSVLVKYEGYTSQEVSIGFDCQQTVDKSVTLQKVADKCCNSIVKVVVKDSKTGNPVVNAKVALWLNGKLTYYAYTNESGLATINEICEGNYGVSVVRDNYNGIEWNIEIGCEKTLTFEKTLVAKETDNCCGKATFYVKDINTGNPIKLTEVKITINNVNKVLKTDENGKVVFTELCPGNYWVRVAPEGYKVLEGDFKIVNCETPVEMALKVTPKEGDVCCDNQIKFTIKDAEGNLLSNVQIKITKGGQIVKTLTTQNGTASTDKNICKGSYGVRIYREGFKVVEYEVTFDCNQVIEHTKVLTKADDCCTAWAKVVVVDNETKAALNGAKVRIWKNGDLVKTLTVEGGYVKFTNLCEGNYGFDITYDGYKGIEWTSQILCNKENIFEKGLIKN